MAKLTDDIAINYSSLIRQVWALFDDTISITTAQGGQLDALVVIRKVDSLRQRQKEVQRTLTILHRDAVTLQRKQRGGKADA